MNQQSPDEKILVHVIGPAILARALESLLSVQSGIRVATSEISDRPMTAPAGLEVVVFLGADRVDPTVLRERCRSVSAGHVLLTNGSDISSGRFRIFNIRAFVGDNEPLPTVIEAIRAAARGQAYCSPQLFSAMLGVIYGERPSFTQETNRFGIAATPPDDLSGREREVATEAAKGLSNEEIADRLHISVSTVKFHLFHTFRKLGVTRRSQLRFTLTQPA